MYQIILFDLDGTITDPGVGITNSVAYALKKWNITVSDRNDLYKFIGPPLQDSFREFYQFSPEECHQAVEYYREYYSQKGIFENKVYPDIEETLQLLKQANKKLLIATSKPEDYAVQILEHFHLAKYFDHICGANMDGTRTKKSDVINYALNTAGFSNPSQVIMVGDRKHDILGAKENRIDSVGVLFGYGNLDELQDAGATYIAQTPKDILKYI